MESEEAIALWKEELAIYQGILFHNRTFENDCTAEFTYDFSCKEYEALREKYDLAGIAGKGSEFERAARLTAHFAPALAHKGDYANEVPCNALALLEYSYRQPEHGINCLNKSKILQECCLALGIYAKRICIMPYSPYDYDNHVVNEIYDAALKKWVMLDVTANGYFSDENGTPLSLLEMRDRFALNRVCNFTKLSDEVHEYFDTREEESAYYAQYFAKNLAYFVVEQHNCFGEKKAFLYFLPKGFNDETSREMKYLFRQNQTDRYTDKDLKRNLACDIRCLTKAPV